MCKVLKFARSTYYEALVRVPSNKEQEYQQFSLEVKQCFDDNKQRYGAIKIHRKLNEAGILCSIKRVQRHMQRQGLRSVVVKKYNHKANQGKVPDDKENVLIQSIRNGLQTLPISMYKKKDGHTWHLLWIFMIVKS